MQGSRWLGSRARSRRRWRSSACGGGRRGRRRRAAQSDEATPARDGSRSSRRTRRLGKIRRRARSRSASSSTCRRSASRTRSRARSRASTSRWARRSPTKLGVKPKFIEAISDNRIPFLEDGTADLILSTMTINEERAEQIGFSDPYFIARGRVLAARRASTSTGVGRPRRARTSARRWARPTRRTLRSRRRRPSSSSSTSYSRVPRAHAERRGRRGLDRRRDPDGHDHPGRHSASSSRRRADPAKPYGGGIKKDDTQMVDFLNGVLRGPTRPTARWAEASRASGSASTPARSSEPPTIGAGRSAEGSS